MGIACSSFLVLLLRHLYTPNYIVQVILIEVLHLLLFIVVVVRFVCQVGFLSIGCMFTTELCTYTLVTNQHNMTVM